MKRISFLLALLLLFLSGCCSNVPRIEEYSWVMSSVQSNEEGGQAVAFGERGSSTLTSARHVELLCMAKNGALTLTDRTNNKTYTGTYKSMQTDPQSSIYEVVVDGKEGMAVVSMTTYQDGSQEATFIMTLGLYTINFFAQQETD